MAVEAGFDAARRLAEALERSRAPLGEGLATETRSSVPPELAQAFRELMEAPQVGTSSPAPEVRGVQPLEASRAPGRIGSVGGSDLAADAKGDLKAGAVSGLEGKVPAAAELPSPAELLAMQFSVGMQMFEAKAGVAARDGVSEQVEEVLRSTN